MEITPLSDPYALKQDGSTPLTADWDAGAYAITTTGMGTFGYMNITDETNGYQIDGTRILSAFVTENIFIGLAGNFTMAGDYNVAIGTDSLIANTSGEKNTAIGNDTLRANTTGSDNVAIGIDALYAIEEGTDNVAIGSTAMSGAVDGYDNVAIGSSALDSCDGGYDNVAIGYSVAENLTSGNSNIFLGMAAGYNQTTNSNLLIIDNQNRSSAANEIVKCLLYGSFNATASSQYLYANVGTFRIGGSDTNDPILRFIGSTNTGDLTYDESDDEFDFGDAAILTTGTLRAGAITGTSFTTGAFTLTIDETAALTDYMQDLVDDSSPQLGGDLDGQSTYDLVNMVDGSFDGTIGVGVAADATRGVYVQKTMALSGSSLYFESTASPTSAAQTFSGASGILYLSGSSYDIADLIGLRGSIRQVLNSLYSGTIDNAYGVYSQIRFYGNLVGADPTVTNAYLFYADPFVVSGGSSVGTAYGLYLPSITQGGTNWGIYSDGGDSAHAGNFNFGSTDAPVAAATVVGTIKIKEQAAADADTAAYGQLWVKNATPCELWFTDDAGTDTQIV